MLQDTNRLAEAERLMRRALAIFVTFGRRTGHQHRHFETAKRNYAGLLQAMGESEKEIEAAIDAVVHPAG